MVSGIISSDICGLLGVQRLSSLLLLLLLILEKRFLSVVINLFSTCTCTCTLTLFLSVVDNLYAGIVYDPRSKALVTSNMPGVLQFYLPQTDHHAFSVSCKLKSIIKLILKYSYYFDDGWVQCPN